MEENNIIQFIEAYSSFAKRLHLSVSPDGRTIAFVRSKFIRRIISGIGYMIIAFSLLLMAFALSKPEYNSIIPFFVFGLLVGCYIVRAYTRTITFSTSDGKVCITGQLRRQLCLEWTNYLGYDTTYSVNDFPEVFFIKFQDRSVIRDVKITDITPFLCKYNPENFEAIKKMWVCIEYCMTRKEE